MSPHDYGDLIGQNDANTLMTKRVTVCQTLTQLLSTFSRFGIGTLGLALLAAEANPVPETETSLSNPTNGNVKKVTNHPATCIVRSI